MALDGEIRKGKKRDKPLFIDHKEIFLRKVLLQAFNAGTPCINEEVGVMLFHMDVYRRKLDVDHILIIYGDQSCELHNETPFYKQKMTNLLRLDKLSNHILLLTKTNLTNLQRNTINYLGNFHLPRLFELAMTNSSHYINHIKNGFLAI